MTTIHDVGQTLWSVNETNVACMEMFDAFIETYFAYQTQEVGVLTNNARRLAHAIKNAEPGITKFETTYRDAALKIADIPRLIQPETSYQQALLRACMYFLGAFAGEAKCKICVGESLDVFGGVANIGEFRVRLNQTGYLALRSAMEPSKNVGPESDVSDKQLPNSNQRKATKSNVVNSKQVVFESNLIAHHQFEDGRVGRWDTLGCNALKRICNSSAGAASDFFKKWFGDHKTYGNICTNRSPKLTVALTQMSGESLIRQTIDPEQIHCDVELE